MACSIFSRKSLQNVSQNMALSSLNSQGVSLLAGLKKLGAQFKL